jgi:hypothetical protein
VRIIHSDPARVTAGGGKSQPGQDPLLGVGVRPSAQEKKKQATKPKPLGKEVCVGLHKVCCGDVVKASAGAAITPAAAFFMPGEPFFR